MKAISVTLLFFLIGNMTYGQDMLLGIKLSAGTTINHVKDLDTRPSGGLDEEGYLRNPADGNTYLVGNHNVLSVGANLDLAIYERLYFSTGLWFTNKGFNIENRDGNYWGQSSFTVTYLQLPLAGKFYFRDVTKGLDLYMKLGFTLDLKAKEALNGSDGSHYWNLAKNYTHYDPTRGKNADHQSMALFNRGSVGVLGSFGAELKPMEELYVFLSISYNAGLINMINPSLRHDDRNATRVADGLKITSDILSADVGVIFPLK